MSLFIKQARELYISTFSTANLKKYSEEDINIQLEGSARIDEYYKSVFILLSKAVLSGEYIFDPNYRKALDAFEADIAMEIGNIDTYFTQRFSDLSLGLKCILKHYVGFLINIEDKIKNSDEEFFFSAFKSDDKNINNEFLSDFISIVLKLASIDHFLIADNDNREILVILREELENRKKVENKDLKDIYSALLDKCNLLLVKMFYDPIIGRNYSLNFKKHSVDVFAGHRARVSAARDNSTYRLWSLCTFYQTLFRKDIIPHAKWPFPFIIGQQNTSTQRNPLPDH